VEDRGEVPGLGDVAYVRRKTGGGAILHDRELTYSLIIPTRSAAEKGHSEKLYRSVHNAIAKGLQCMGWDAVLSETCTCSTASNPKLEPFLCFSRRSPVDLIVEQNKVLGSAQFGIDVQLINGTVPDIAVVIRNPELNGGAPRNVDTKALEKHAAVKKALALDFGVVLIG
jgi:hypothetical protein